MGSEMCIRDSRKIALTSDKKGLLATVAKQAKTIVRQKLKKPSRAELAIQRLESRLELGELQIRVRSLESDRTLKLIQLGIKSLIFTCLTGFTLLSATMFFLGAHKILAFVMFGLTGFWFFLLMKYLTSLAVKEKIQSRL